MRNRFEIAATAGFFVCALVYAAQTSAAQSAPVDWTTQDALLARDVADVGAWAAAPMARCYAEELSVDGLKDGSAPARALACDGSALQPVAG